MTREEQIDWLCRLRTDLNNGVIFTPWNKEFTEALNDVLEQEPKTGHWVHGEYCSECGCDVPAYIDDWKWQKDMDAKYCPNCGCYMVEPQKVRNKKNDRKRSYNTRRNK